MDCLFCKMVKGEIKPNVVYENERVLAFKDINPQAPVHILVIPKKHYENILETEVNEIVSIFEGIKTIALNEGLDEGFRIVNNCGDLGGQTVHHLHFHLLGKRKMKWPPG